MDRHTFIDDAQALLAGTLFIALGVAMFAAAGLPTGGTVGIAFLVHYATGIPFGPVFFVINLPFYLLAIRRMGWRFTAKTLVAVSLLSVFAEALPRLMRFAVLDAVYAALMGGLLVGAGLMMLFRHRASLGGLNVLILYLQDRFGWRAGKVQLGIDFAILAASLAVVPARLVAISLLGALALNLTLAINHKPGRYIAT